MQRPLQGLTRANFLSEATAGVTLLAISVPLNIGYAQIAGLPASAGLYALIVPTIIYALLVSSRQVVASPDAAAAALVFSSLAGLGVAGENFATMAAAQAILSGFMFLLASWLKLGFLANFLSKPILVGFVGGLALEIMISQLAKMLGLKLKPGEEFFSHLLELFGSLEKVNMPSMLLALGALAILLVGRRLGPAIPWALVVLVLGTLATGWLGLEARGVAVLGEVPAGPPDFAFPQVGLAQWLALIPSALALTMVTIAEGLLVIRSYAEQHHDKTDSNRDLLAFGAANIASGLSSSFAVGSSTSRTAAMDQAGSRTQLPSLVLAAGSLLLLLFGTEMLALIPSPAIGAVVAVAVFKLLGLGELRELFGLSRAEFGIAVVCFLGVLVVGPLGGLFLAFVLSLVNLARRAANPELEVLVGGADPSQSFTGASAESQQSAPGVTVLRMVAPIFFANASLLADHMSALTDDPKSRPAHLVLDLGPVGDIDVTGAETLRQSIDKLAQREVVVAYSRMRPALREQFAAFDLLNGVNEYATNREAVATLVPQPHEHKARHREEGIS